MYVEDTRLDNPVIGAGIDTQHVAAAVVVFAIVALWGIRRGFRGVNLAGVHVGIR
jgi:hypothetical protein